MNPLNSKTIRLLAAAILFCAVSARFATAERPDAWITTQARIALLTTDGAGRTAVKVDTDHGKVTLHGKVHSQAVKDKAEATVRGVEGVTGVQNLLEVVSEAREDAVKASDNEVKEAVKAALKHNQSLEGIKVESVDNGVVLLNGHTKTLHHKLLAIETAYDCKGVRHVTSKIESPNE